MDEELWLHITKDVKKIKHRFVPKNNLNSSEMNDFKPNPNLLFNLKIPTFHTLTPKKRISIPDVDARIDLHGLTKIQAFEKLEAFLKQACINGKKHALIITGKGQLDNPGAIKLEVPRWLEHTELKKYLISYSVAKPNLGGEGAISVMLKGRSLS